MKSMTGFGKGEAAGENFSVAVELKTVNNRFLDLSFRTTQELQPLEAELKQIVSSRLSRGRVDVFLNYEINQEIAYEINRPLVKGYLTVMKEIGAEFGIAGEPDLNFIARLPNALQPKKNNLNEDFVEGVKRAFSLALDDLETMRLSEGASLKEEIESRLTEIEKRLQPIEEEAENIPNEYRERLKKRIEDILKKGDSQFEIDQARLAQEVAYLSDRADISEEIVRLKSHIAQYRQIMDEEKDVGKRLDFLTQELNREANTISSKTGNLKIKENALAIKSEIEKIREQIQNVE